MKRFIDIFAITASITFLMLMISSQLIQAAEDEKPQNSRVLVLEIDSAIGPAIAEFLREGLTQAEENGAALLVVRLDTPGGLDMAMRNMIKGILSSKVPVAVYVAPGGARAASAGTYLLYAAHIAAMAPATNTGSATPVQLGGMPGIPEQPALPNSSDEQETPRSTLPHSESDEKIAQTEKDTLSGKSAMERKIENDAAAYIRSLAKYRQRNVQWAEEAVRKGANISASEALELKVIDVMADNITDLLSIINGRTVKMGNGKERVLHTEAASIEYMEVDWRTRFLSVITDPNVAYILMLLGFYGLIYEFLNPGAFVPGVIGGICLLMAFYALQVLPINYAGLALMLLGIIFMIAEAKVSSFGVLGLGGIIAFSVGSIILMDDEGYKISLPLIAGNAVVAAGFFIWVLGMVMRIRNRPLVSGQEQMLGAIAEVSEDFLGEGFVFVMGERWQAVSDEALAKGQKVNIVSIDGLCLKVKPV